jgi:hypothetical protein
LSAACEKVVAVALVRRWCGWVRASVRWRMVESVAAVASAPPATELAARSSWRIMRSEFELPAVQGLPWPNRPSALTASARPGPAELGFSGRRSRFRHRFSKQTERHGCSSKLRMWPHPLIRHEVMVNNA